MSHTKICPYFCFLYRRPLQSQPQRRCPGNSLQSQARGTDSKHGKSPRVGSFLDLGPETVLGLLILGEFLGLNGAGLCVSLCLGGFILSITTDVAQEGVVGKWAKKDEWVKFAGTPEEEREGEVHQSVAEVASTGMSARPNGERRRKKLEENTYLGWRTMLQTPARFRVAS